MYVPASNCRDVLSVDDVESMIEEAKGRVLPIPGRPEYDASEIIMRYFVNQWKEPSITLVERVHDILHSLVSENLVEQAVSNRFKKIKNKCQEITNDLLRERSSLTTDRVTNLWGMEQNLFTTKGEELRSIRNNFITWIKSAIVGDATMESSVSSAITSLQSIQGVKEQLINLFSVPDVMAHLAKIGLTKESLLLMNSNRVCSDKVIETIASAMAYFHLKAPAYGDSVGSHVLHHLLGDFVAELGNEVCKKMGVFSSPIGELHHLFSEGAEVGKYREELNRKRERQKEALNLINDHLAKA